MTLSACDNSDLKNLGYNTMCSLMSGSVQALIDAIGYEEAYRRLEPHIHLNSQFVIALFPLEVGIDINDNEGIARLILYLITLSSRGKPSYEVGKESATLFQKKCRNNGQFPHMCDWWCRRDWEQVVKDGCKSKILKQIASIDRGDELCCWKIEPRYPPNGPDEQLLLPNPDFSMERLDYWARAGPGEYWNNASQVMLELVGEDRGRRLLCKYAKIQGEAYGDYCLSSIGKDRGRDLLIRSVEQGDEMWDVKSEWSAISQDRLERVVHECPFSGATVSPCDQIQSFWLGACSVIAPEWTPQYLSMKTKGDNVCKMVFSLSTPNDTGKPSLDKKKEDPMHALKMRYVRGEITEEEFREKMAVLKEFDL